MWDVDRIHVVREKAVCRVCVNAAMHFRGYILYI